MKINVWNEQIQLENPELVIGRIANLLSSKSGMEDRRIL